MGKRWLAVMTTWLDHYGQLVDGEERGSDGALLRPHLMRVREHPQLSHRQCESSFIQAAPAAETNRPTTLALAAILGSHLMRAITAK